MALFRKFFYRKPPDGLLEISERVHVFDCCFTTDIWEGDEYKVYVDGIVNQLREYSPDASYMVFNFREGEQQSRISSILSEYDMTVMDYPRHYEGCPLLTMEMIHHFLRSSESWLTLAPTNVLLMHCERGGWPVLAFMLAALLLYRKQFSGEQKTLDMVYKQAPRELLHLMSPLNPMPSQLRYLQYVSRRNVGYQWPPLDRALTLDCIILRVLPNLDGEGGCRPIFRIYGRDPLTEADRTPKVLFSTPKRSKLVRHYKQADCELVKIDIHCNIQGDVVMECISVDEGQDREEMMFRVMFNTAFIRSNILILNRDEIDSLWDGKDQFPKEFRTEVLFSEMDSPALSSIDLPALEEKDGLPAEAFARVHEIFSHVDWSDTKPDVALNVLQHITTLQQNFDSSSQKAEVDSGLLESTLEKIIDKPDLSETKSKIQSPTTISPRREPVPILKPSEDANSLIDKTNQELKDALRSVLGMKPFEELIKEKYEPPKPQKSKDSFQVVTSKPSTDANSTGRKAEPQELQIALQRPVQSKIITPPAPHGSSLQGSTPISRYNSAPSALGITALLQDHAAVNSKEGFPAALSTPPSAISSSVKNLAKTSQLTPVSGPPPPPPSPPPPPPPPKPTPTCPPLENSTEVARPPEKLSSAPLTPSQPTPKVADPLVNQHPEVPTTPPPSSAPLTPSRPTSKATDPRPTGTVQSLSIPPPPPTPPPSFSGSFASPATESASSASPALSVPPASVSGTSPSTTAKKPSSTPPAAPTPPPPPPPPPSSVSGTSTSSAIKNLSSAPLPPPPPPRVDSASIPPPPPPPRVDSAPIPPPPPPRSESSLGSVPAAPPPPPGSAPSNGPAPPPPPPFTKGSSTTNGPAVPPVPGPPSSSLLKGRGLSRPGQRAQGQVKKSNLKPYHWLKLTRVMQGSIWAEAQKPDEASKAPEIDMRELETLFSAAAPNSDRGSKGGKSSRINPAAKPEKVQLIELRRAYNCEIMLSKVKIPLPELMNSVLALDDTGLDIDQIDNLIKFCPTKEEMETLKGYTGDKENLGKCEQFFLELMKVPRVESKLRVFSFKLQFHPQIRNSVKLKRIMQTILSLGNALNQGTARGAAVGFRLDSLLKLTDTRARTGRMTLMHYLCKVLAEKLPELLDFAKDLIQLKYLAEEMQAISKGLEKVVQELTASENDGAISENFCKILKEFLVSAEGEVRSLASLYSCVGRNADALALYFGEDPARCPFEQGTS
ncbi:hypothetical protein Tsubulata_019432 [Turnera subulata]|uniref:Formin-like protein n=1 Tax=Turnera subulata TaxID=218843 RepID=A0A9Q0F7W0_9ROSI|nr:hypothetical protein Tsubulata_019432 [Turnera subulata]